MFLELKKTHWKKLSAVITADAVGTDRWMVFVSALSEEQQKILTDPKLLHHWLGRKPHDEDTRFIEQTKAADLMPRNLVPWTATPICFDFNDDGDRKDLRLFQAEDGQSAWFLRQQLEIFKHDGSHEVLYGEKSQGTFVVRLNGKADGDLLGLISSFMIKGQLTEWVITRAPEVFSGVIEGVKPIETPAEEGA